MHACTYVWWMGLYIWEHTRILTNNTINVTINSFVVLCHRCKIDNIME